MVVRIECLLGRRTASKENSILSIIMSRIGPSLCRLYQSQRQGPRAYSLHGNERRPATRVGRRDRGRRYSRRRRFKRSTTVDTCLPTAVTQFRSGVCDCTVGRSIWRAAVAGRLGGAVFVPGYFCSRTQISIWSSDNISGRQFQFFNHPSALTLEPRALAVEFEFGPPTTSSAMLLIRLGAVLAAGSASVVASANPAQLRLSPDPLVDVDGDGVQRVPPLTAPQANAVLAHHLGVAQYEHMPVSNGDQTWQRLLTVQDGAASGAKVVVVLECGRAECQGEHDVSCVIIP